jgi:hypothetical protein
MSSLLPASDPPRRGYAEEHDKLIVKFSHLLGSAGRHKRVDLVEVSSCVSRTQIVKPNRAKFLDDLSFY